jgi:CRP-like cAMP-binding protein
MFSLKTGLHENGEILQEQGDDASVLYIILDGSLEIYTSFEGMHFTIENIYKGSIINYRTFFMEDHGHAFFKFTTASTTK